MDWASYVPGGVDSDGEVALAAGIPALAFATIHDARFGIDSPLDRVDEVNCENLARQIELLKGVLCLAFDDPEFLGEVEDIRGAVKDQLRDLRVKVRTVPRRSQVPDRPVLGALVAVETAVDSRKGVRGFRYGLTDERGTVTFAGLPQRTYRLAVFALSAADGGVAYAPDLSLRAQKFHGNPLKTGFLGSQVRWTTNEKRVVVFPALSGPSRRLTSASTPPA